MTVYAIPSRARAHVLVEKTLPLLRRLGVPELSTNVYVAAAEEAEYRATLRNAGFGAIVCRGEEGMNAQRHAIHKDPDLSGRFVIQLDDDLRDLVIRRDERTLEPIDADGWAELVAAGEVELDAGARLWGVYPVPNAYFMKPRVRRDLCYIGGGLFGYVSRPARAWWAVTLDDKEDFERSIRAYIAGGVARFDYVSWRTTGYAGAGGMQTDGQRTDERIRRSAESLARRYPDLCSLNLTKKSGKAELRLRDRRCQRETA